MPFESVNGLKTFYEERGRGKPLFLVHGAGGTSAYWFNELAHLSKKLSVIAVDLPGHGKSERMKNKPTIELYAEHVANLVNQMKLGKVVLLGHSMGGLVAQQIALEHPMMLEKLIIVDSSANFPIQHDYTDHMRKGDFNPIEFASRFFSPKTLKKANIVSLLQQMTQEMTANYDLNIIADDFELTGKVDLRGRLKDINTPTLIVHGADDIIPLSSAKYLHENIRGSQLEIIPDAGHLVMIEKPTEFDAVVLKFIET